MGWALEEARAAASEDEVPVGAVLVDAAGRLLARDHNRIEQSRDPTAHAERLVLSAACVRLGAPRLPPGTLLAVSLEPCAMCAGAIVLARVDHLVFGAADPKTGACGSLRDVVRDPRLNHRVDLLPPVMADECGELLRAFFRVRRGAP
ncbi:MAG: nucleoside deaminase [Planctomycetes bacterium]|nr:nucleoside deaminase [Planctomycetota bacterium]